MNKELKGSTPLRQQLQNPVFRQWMSRSPLRRGKPEGHNNWHIYVKLKRKSGWRHVKRDFATYREAYRFLAKHLPDVYDIALCSKLTRYGPPINEDGLAVIPMSLHPNDWWCGFCRRVTRFKYYKKHHAVPAYYLNRDERYCEVCGARLSYATRYDIQSTPNPRKKR